MNYRARFSFSLLSVLTALPLAPVLRAQSTVYWDGSGSGIVGGGTGAWSTSAARWSTTPTGTTYAAWTNGNSANFANTAGTVTVSGGATVNDLTFGVSGYTVTGGTLTFGSSSAIATGAFAATINSTLAGSGVGFTKTGSGTLTLGGTSSYTRTTTIKNGIVSVSANANLGNGGAVAFGGGILYLTASFNSTRAVSLGTGGGTFNTVGSGTASAWSGAITGAAATDGLAKSGSGTLTLSGANTYFGATTINTGTLAIDAESRLGANPATFDAAHLTLDGATLQATATFAINDSNRGITLGAGGGTFMVDPTFTFQIANSIAETGGPAALTKTGTGTLKLTGANSYTGATIISAGALNLQNALALGTSAAGTTVASGATLQLQGGITVASEALTLNGTGASATGALRNISGTNVFSGPITLGSAAEIRADSASTLTLGGGISGPFGLTFDGAGDTTVSGVIGTGTGALIKNGSGTLTLSGNNTYTGGTTLNAGTLSLGASNRLANTGGVTLAGGTFDLGAFSDTVGAVTLQSGNITGTTGVLTGSSYSLQSGTVSAILGGIGALTKSTSGTVTLSGANT
ncbi:MAG: autotransporter-associated beta strand repeat-containing protein, partial [Undibacterium sp.]|nr:autotransporter-associated beta strand repeat-containing protein [Opitutaceae bacterium]